MRPDRRDRRPVGRDGDVRVNGNVGRARSGFADAERYERARPGYPEEAVAALLACCGIGPGTRVLDLAAGTGKLTRRLVDAGADVVAVDPSADMRDVLRRLLPQLEVRAGTAEAIPLPDSTVDAVCVAQAFHWFDGPAALREIHRVLRPAGAIGLMWNVMDRDVEWVDRVQELMHVYRRGNPWYHGHAWRVAFEVSDAFTPLGSISVRNAQSVDLEGLLERIASVSFVSDLTDDARATVLGGVARIVAEASLDAGAIVIPYRTDLFWARSVDTVSV